MLWSISVIQTIEMRADMNWPKALAIFGFLLLFLNWCFIIIFLMYKYLTRGRAECKIPTPATWRRSKWEMSQSGVGDSLDTNTFFSTTEQEGSEGQDSLNSSSPVEMTSRRVFISLKNDRL